MRFNLEARNVRKGPGVEWQRWRVSEIEWLWQFSVIEQSVVLGSAKEKPDFSKSTVVLMWAVAVLQCDHWNYYCKPNLESIPSFLPKVLLHF